METFTFTHLRFRLRRQDKLLLQPPYDGPYSIIASPSNRYYVLAIKVKKESINLSHLPPAHVEVSTPTTDFQPTTSIATTPQQQHNGNYPLHFEVGNTQVSSKVSWGPTEKESHIKSFIPTRTAIVPPLTNGKSAIMLGKMWAVRSRSTNPKFGDYRSAPEEI